MGFNKVGDKDHLLSENIQMYLVSIARLEREGQPVALSRLADTLGISPVSANQMCRKLQDQGLVAYTPYKGVSLTPEGEQLAARILRRHRLWEVFLVEHLRMSWEEAHEAACRLEHATPDRVVERLDEFLGHPRVNPQGEPIPSSSDDFPRIVLRPLAEMEAGQSGHFVRCTADETTCAFLVGQGLRPGAPFQVVAVAPESLLIEVDGRRVALSRSLAAMLQVEPDGRQAGGGAVPSREPSKDEGGEPIRMPLDQLAVGQQGIIIRIGGEAHLRRRLLDMGIVPGETVTVERVAPLGDPVEFTVKGYHLSLRKSEAAQILVELESN